MAKQATKAKAETASPEAATFGAFSAAPTEAMQAAFEKFTSFSGDFGGMARTNMEAMTQSAQAASKGFSELNTKAFGFMQANMQRNMDAARAFGGVRTAEDFATIQEASKETFQAYAEQANEMSTLFAGTLRAAAEPLNAQASAVVEKLQTAR